MRRTIDKPRPLPGASAPADDKTLTNARERLRANAWAVIAHPELAGVERDIDLTAARAIAHRVIQQIAHQQTEQQRLAGAGRYGWH